jgi:hypothetical protein
VVKIKGTIQFCTAPQKLELNSKLWGVSLWLNIVKNNNNFNKDKKNQSSYYLLD